MAHPILPLLVALAYGTLPQVDLNAQLKEPISCMKSDPSLILIADSHGGEDPHGDDPHGPDPHYRGWKEPDDQRHYGGPANDDREKYPGHDDPYGDFKYKVPQPNP